MTKNGVEYLGAASRSRCVPWSRTTINSYEYHKTPKMYRIYGFWIGSLRVHGKACRNMHLVKELPFCLSKHGYYMSFEFCAILSCPIRDHFRTTVAGHEYEGMVVLKEVGCTRRCKCQLCRASDPPLPPVFGPSCTSAL